MAENFKKLIRERLLDEMLGSVKGAGAAEWSVLVLDSMTTRVMSYACRVSDILDYGISLVENVAKRREPLLALSGVYFITPTDASVKLLIEDFKTRPLYKTAHVFFSSKSTPQQLNAIKNCPGLTARLRTLKEVNLEVLTLDRRCFVTAEECSLAALYGENQDASAAYRQEVGLIAQRLATAFASLKEFPSIRFRVAKSGEDETTGLEARALVGQRIALELQERLDALRTRGVLPAADTCDLIILDRGFDPVAPIIHEWTYEAMAYDLLNLEGSVFRYETETQGGKMEKKEHVLDDKDEMWAQLRHKHFAAATTAITQQLDEFRTRNKAAAYKGGGADAGSLDMRNMRGLVQSLPQYREQLARLSVHVELASRINRAIEERALVELGKLEQDLVFGDATSKEVITFLSNHQDLPAQDKVRLLMCYVATHPEKMDSTKQLQWQKLAKLSPDDMQTILNLEHLGVPVRKRGKSTGLVFGRKRKRAVRKDRDAEEDDQQFALSRFTPLVQEVLEDLAAAKLSTDEFPYVRTPAADAGSGFSSKVASVRSNRTTAGWAKKAAGGKADEAPAKGKRVVVFVVGGMTRSELRSAHRLSSRINREIIIGGTTMDTPSIFLKRLAALTGINSDQVGLEIDFVKDL